MKNTILKFLVICLMTQSYGVSSFAQVASPLDLDKLQAIVESGELSAKLAKGEITQDQFEDLYNNYVDLIESGGETAFITPPSERVFETDADAALAMDENIKEIGSPTNIGELQKYAEKQVAGYGNWSFHFVYIGNDGTRKVLTGRDINTPLRPASTMKLFSTSLAYDLGTYSETNMIDLLKHSRNGKADKALKSVTLAQKYSDFKIPADSYLKDPALLNYGMLDRTETYRKGKTTKYVTQIIDSTILKGCAIMKDAYKSLEDSSKFHPVNGSGLQNSDKDQDIHENKVTARLETALLEKIFNNKAKYNKYKKFLPTPGGVGTLSARFKMGRKLAKIYAKTGTLGATKSLAGYAETAKGTIIFSVIGDRLKGVGVKEAMRTQIENVVFAHLQYMKTQEEKAGK